MCVIQMNLSFAGLNVKSLCIHKNYLIITNMLLYVLLDFKYLVKTSI